MGGRGIWWNLSDHQLLTLCKELVIIRDLDVDRFASLVGPLEAHTPLIVDPDAVLTFSISVEWFEAVSWWGSQVKELRRGIKPIERHMTSSPGNALEPANMFIIGKLLGITVSILWGHAILAFLGCGIIVPHWRQVTGYVTRCQELLTP